MTCTNPDCVAEKAELREDRAELQAALDALNDENRGLRDDLRDARVDEAERLSVVQAVARRHPSVQTLDWCDPKGMPRPELCATCGQPPDTPGQVLTGKAGTAELDYWAFVLGLRFVVTLEPMP